MVADCSALLRNIRWVMDNMKSHHAKAVKNLLDSSEIRYIYLPPSVGRGHPTAPGQ